MSAAPRSAGVVAENRRKRRFPPVRRKKDEEIRGRMEKRRRKRERGERGRNGRACFQTVSMSAAVVGGPSPSHDGDADDAAPAVSLGSRASEITGIQVSADRVVP